MKIRPVGFEVHADGETRRTDTDMHDEPNRRLTQILRTCLGSVTKERSRSCNLGPRALVWSPTTAQCASAGTLGNKIYTTYGTPRLLEIHFWRDTITDVF